MDDKGVVPLSALAKFPKLHQIDTTVEDLIKAFQNNHFVAAVDMQHSEKGAQRRDKLCSADVVNRNGVDKSGFSDAPSGGDNNSVVVVGGGGGVGNVTMPNPVADLHMTIANSDVGPGQQNQSYYVYNQAALLPTLYSPQAGIMPTATSLGATALPSYNPYIMTNFPYATGAGSVGLGQSQSGGVGGGGGGHHSIGYPSGSIVWPVSGASADYGGHALLSQLQQQQQQQQTSQPSLPSPYGHHHNNGSGAVGVGNARFLSAAASVNGAFCSPVQTVVAAAATAGTVAASEPSVAANRMN